MSNITEMQYSTTQMENLKKNNLMIQIRLAGRRLIIKVVEQIGR